MKKVLSYVLVLCMILGSFGMAFAAAPADVAGEKYEDAVNVLMELGVIDGYKDGTYRPANIVTRAEMATLIIKALGLNDYAVGKSNFKDMNGHWADPYVAYASSLGFIAGYSDGTFRPNETVSYDQAITMLVQALGYKADYLVGGYPGAFVTQAKTLGMLDGIKSGAAGANRGDVAQLLYNTLPAAFVRYDNDGALQYIALSDDRNDTMLMRLGVGEHNEGEAFVVKGTEDAAINLAEYQGAYVTAYCDNADDCDDCEIIAIEEVKSVFVTGDLEDGVFTAEDDTEYKLSRLDDNDEVYVFENGLYVETIDLADLEDADDLTVAVKISGKYFTALYSVASWDTGVTIQWTDDYAETLEEDKEIDDITLPLNDDDEVDMDELVLLGVDSLEDIEKDHVVTYYVADEDGDKEIVKIEVGTEVVEGEVSRINSVGDVATIDGKKYDITEDCDSFEVGAEGTFWLNYAGDIAFIDVTNEADDYAIVTYENKMDEGSYSEDGVMKIKLLTADGKEAVYVIDEDYVYDEDDNQVINNDDYKKGDLIAYSLNKDGEIDLIKKITPEDTEGAKVTAKGYLAGVKVSDNVVVFVDEDDDFTVGDVKDVPSGEALDHSSYYVDEEDGEIVVIILSSEDQVDDDSVYGVVLGYGTAKNADGDKVYAVDMLVDGGEETLLTVSRSVEVPTKAALYEIVFDGSDVEKLVEVSGSSVWAENEVVEAIKDGNIKVDGKYVEVSSDVIVYLYDAEDEEFTVSKFSSISKKDTVTMYELDGTDDDENGVDVIIFEQN